MIDYILNYPNANAARAGTVAAAHGASPEGVFAWKGSHVVEVKAWKPSEDTTDDDGNVVHNYLSGVWLLVSTAAEDAVSKASAHMMFELGREECKARGQGCLRSRKGSAPSADDFRIEPMFMGMDVQWDQLTA